MIQSVLKWRRVFPRPIWRLFRELCWSAYWRAEERSEQQRLGRTDLPRLRHSERAELIETICDHAPFESLLEVGVGPAKNFPVLHRLLPKVQLMGVDQDVKEIEAASQNLKTYNIQNAAVQLADARSLGRFPNQGFDVVISCASLLYIAGEDIENVLSEMLRVSKRAVILLEQHIDCPAFPQGVRLPENGKRPEYWIRDYVTLLSTLSPGSQLRLIPVTNPIWVTEKWGECATVIELTHGKR